MHPCFTYLNKEIINITHNSDVILNNKFNISATDASWVMSNFYMNYG